MLNNKDFGFLITAYKQIGLVEQNILRIRDDYKHLNKSPIIIVTTCEYDIGFIELEYKYNDVYVIEYPNAPNPNNKISKSNTTLTSKDKFIESKAPVFDWADRGENDGFVPGTRWRYEYIAARILLSMRLGFIKSFDLGIKTLLHLHSDSWWETSHEENLIRDIEKVRGENLLFYGDISEALDNGRWEPGFLFCPEGIIFNLDVCKRIGYGFNFDEIYFNNDNTNGILNNNKQFFCSDFSSTEPLLSEFALWKLTGKNYYEYDIIPNEYYNKVKVRMRRPFHGNFSSGLCNKETKQ